MPPQTRLSYSAKDCHDRCPKRYYWKYERGLVPIEEAVPLTLGKFYHQGTAALCRAKAKLAGPSTPIQGTSEPAEIARFLVKLYAQYFSEDTLEYVGVEVPFQFWLRKPDEKLTHVDPHLGIVFSGQIDALAILDDQLWVVERKTTSQLDQDYLAKLPLDSQVTAYSLGAMSWLKRSENKDVRKRVKGKVAGVIYDVAGKPRKYRRDGEGCLEWLARCEPKYIANFGGWFIRQPCYRASVAKLDYVKSLLYTASLIEGSRSSGYWDMHTGMSFLRSQECPYSPLCIRGEVDSTLMGYRIEEPFSEISGPLPRPNTIKLG